MDHSTLSRNRGHLHEHKAAPEFFNEIVKYAKENDLLSSEHFTVDGTLIQAFGAQKSFQRKDGPKPPSGGGSDVRFEGKQRSNATHQSSTDSEAL